MPPSSTVTERMRNQVRIWEGQGDHRSIFLSCYALMTENMLSALDQGRFEDVEWVDRLLHRFAGYYFDALSCYERGKDPVPPVWHQVHESSTRRPLHVLQHLLLGMNAHINFDLVLTLDELLEQDWCALGSSDRARRHADHLLVNDVIAETIDEVQDRVVERYDPRLDWLDRLLGRLDERLLSAVVTHWRDDVWKEAVGLIECSDRGDRTSRITSLERDVLDRGRLILRFG